MGEAASAEEITQQSVLWKNLRIGDMKQDMHTEREKERHKEYISLLATVTNEQPTTFTKGYKVTLYSDSLRATALYANYTNGPNLGYQRG